MHPQSFVFSPFQMIAIDEVARCGSGGVLWGLFEGLQIGLPPVLNYGSEYLKEKVLKKKEKHH